MVVSNAANTEAGREEDQQMRALGQFVGRCLLGLTVVSFAITALVPYPALAAGTPTVTINQPANGAQVGADIWVDTVYQSASPAHPIVRLDLIIDQQVVRSYILPTPRVKGEATFSYSFRSDAGSAHKISVRALDDAGAVGAATISVTVKKLVPATADQTPPVVNIYYPHPGQQLSGTVELKADATDNVGVEWVFFYVDGQVAAMIKGDPPYTDDWDTTTTTDGQHTIQAKAWDQAENEGASPVVTVTVANRESTKMETTLPQAPAAAQGSAAATGTPAARTAAQAAPQAASQTAAATSQAVAPAAAQQQPEAAPVLPLPAPVAKSVPSRAQAAQASASTAATPTASAPQTEATSGALLVASHGQSAEVSAAAEPRSLAPATHGRSLAALPQRSASAASMARAGATPATAPAATTPATAPEQIAFLPSATPISTIARTIAAASTALAPVDTAASPDALVGHGTPALAGRLLSAPAGTQALAPSQAVTPSRTLAPKTQARPAPRVAARLAPSRMARAASPAPLSSSAQMALATRGPEAYMIAMLPKAGMPANGEVRGTTPGTKGSNGRCTVTPLALSGLRDVKVLYDGKLVPLRACPEVCQGIPTGPLREIFARSDGVLYWLPAEKRVKGDSPNVKLDLQIGHRQATVNGQEQELSLAPYIKSGRTMVPLSFLADALHLTISFNSTRGQLIVSRAGM